jgi:hypothetical protein
MVENFSLLGFVFGRTAVAPEENRSALRQSTTSVVPKEIA